MGLSRNSRIVLTAFLDGFSMAGLFSRLRWFGAPTVAMAPSPEGSLDVVRRRSSVTTPPRMEH